MCNLQEFPIPQDSTLIRTPIKVTVSKSAKTCPVCKRSDDVRISGRKANVTQYLCTFCQTYFIPSTVNSERKKIWHDKIFFKRIRILTKYLSVKK